MKAKPRAALRILVACDAFKGSASASAVNQAIALGLGSTLPDAVVCCLPLADGGEGTLDVLADALGMRRRSPRRRHSVSAKRPSLVLIDLSEWGC